MELDLTGRDLRTETFRGSSMEGASLRDSDLRGVDLSGANLCGADLRGVRTGMRGRWAAFVVSLALVASITAGVAAGYAGRLLHRAIASEARGVRALGIFIAVALAAFLLTMAIGGLRRAVRVVLPIEAGVVLVAGLVAVATGVGTGRAALIALAYLIVVSLTVTLAVLSRTVAGGAGAGFFFIVAMTGALSGAVLGGGLAATAIAIAALVAGQRALRGSKGSPAMERIASSFVARGGTRFCGADLSGARMSHAKLSASDFRGAHLDGVDWSQATRRLCIFDGEPPPIPRRERARRSWRAASRIA